MTATNHALTGAAIALAVKKPELAVPLAFASHFALDAIPHFHSSQASARLAKLVIFADITFAPIATILLAVLLVPDHFSWLVAVCAFAGMSPDLVWGWRLFKLRDLARVAIEPMSKFSRFHKKIQWGENQKLGAAIEIAWFLIMGLVILSL